MENLKTGIMKEMSFPTSPVTKTLRLCHVTQRLQMLFVLKYDLQVSVQVLNITAALSNSEPNLLIVLEVKPSVLGRERTAFLLPVQGDTVRRCLLDIHHFTTEKQSRG